MSRTFPRTTRRRGLAALLVTGMLIGVATVPLASAEDLKDKKNRIERKLDGAHADLEASSGQLRRAEAALGAAQTQLGSAQAKLARTRGELTAAEVLDQQMQAKLRAAVERLGQARADLVAGHQKIAQEQDDLGAIVVANYQAGDPSLMGLSMLLTSQDPTDLTGQLNSVQNVLDKEAVVLDRLEASRALLTVQELEVEEARAKVADEREAAAQNLLRKQGLEAQAESVELQVQNLVALRAKARAEATKARAADRAQLEGLEKERNRIAAVLKKRADAARRRAAAAAAAAGAVGPVVGDSGPISSNGYLNYPVSGYVTSPYGWRNHPIYGYRSLHDGTDFGAACGTPVRAAASGLVLERYFQTAWGNRIVLDHGLVDGAGLATISNHLRGFAVEVGDRVQRGQVIGYIGSTGWSTGCHLHYTVLQDGSPVDPMSWF